MTSNSPAHFVAATDQTPVSGWSILWAVLAIITHSMLQVSFTGQSWSGDSFEGSLSPHRSSPPVCLFDAVADFRNPSGDEEGQNTSKTKSIRTGLLA